MMTNFTIPQLANQNIWWDEPDNIYRDITIQRYEQMPLKWAPTVLQNLEYGRNNIYVLRGPRQIGKTTALKLLIKEKLLSKKVSPVALFYYTCDALETFHDLIALLETYLGYARFNTSGELYIFLDEISDIENWQKAIKLLVDTGKLANTTLFLTGSNAYDLIHASERLPGRRGTSQNLDRIFHPLKFGEYVALMDPKIGAILTQTRPFDLESISDLVRIPGFTSLLSNKNQLDLYLDQYLISGGFITAINDFYQNQAISPFVYEIYLQWIKGDFARYKKQERFLKQIIRRIIISLGSDIGWNSFTKDSEISSHNTVIDYIEILEASFMVKTLYQIDINKQMAVARKNKKFYFIDSHIFHAFRGWLWAMNDSFRAGKMFIENDIDKSKLIENIAMIHFHRYFDGELFFWKNRTEIDLVGKKNRKLYPIEIKYQAHTRMRNHPIEKIFNQPLLVLTRDDFRPAGVPMMIPISLLLATI